MVSYVAFGSSLFVPHMSHILFPGSGRLCFTAVEFSGYFYLIYCYLKVTIRVCACLGDKRLLHRYALTFLSRTEIKIQYNSKFIITSFHSEGVTAFNIKRLGRNTVIVIAY